MSDHLLIDLIDDPVYTKICQLRGTEFEGHSVTLYVECMENNDSERSDDHYAIYFFFTADGFVNRDFIIGVLGGHRGMSQQELDNMIASWIRGVIADRVRDAIDGYLMKEYIYEQWLARPEEEPE